MVLLMASTVRPDQRRCINQGAMDRLAQCVCDSIQRVDGWVLRSSVLQARNRRLIYPSPLRQLDQAHTLSQSLLLQLEREFMDGQQFAQWDEIIVALSLQHLLGGQPFALVLLPEHTNPGDLFGRPFDLDVLVVTHFLSLLVPLS